MLFERFLADRGQRKRIRAVIPPWNEEYTAYSLGIFRVRLRGSALGSKRIGERVVQRLAKRRGAVALGLRHRALANAQAIGSGLLSEPEARPPRGEVRTGQGRPSGLKEPLLVLPAVRSPASGGCEGAGGRRGPSFEPLLVTAPGSAVRSPASGGCEGAGGRRGPSFEPLLVEPLLVVPSP